MSAYHKKLAALLAAGLLAIGAVGAASAASVTPTEHDGNIQIGTGEPPPNSTFADCDPADAILFGTDEDGEKESDNGVSVTVEYNDDDKGFDFDADGGLVTIAYVKGSNSYNEYDYGAGVESDEDLYAPGNPSEGPAGVSHIIFCTAEVVVTEPPTAPPTATPFQSVEQETDAPTETPFQSVGGETEEPSEPDTATIGGSNQVGAPSDGAWLLVVALGVLLASVVVLTPARAKAPRR